MNSSHYRIFQCIGVVLNNCVSAINLDVAPSFSVLCTQLSNWHLVA